MQYAKNIGVYALLFAATISTAQGANLNPGDAIALSGTTSAASPQFGGVILHDELIPFEIFTGDALLYKGNLQNRVYKSNVDGKLVFDYMIRDTMPGLNGILVSADTTNFAGYSIDIDYRTDSLGTKPTTRAQRDVSGATVSMIYGNSIFSGEESLHTGLKTDADFYAKVGTTTLKLQTGESVTLKTMAPVPEPSTIALLTLGVCSVWFMRRR